jgi:hypothetical protein
MPTGFTTPIYDGEDITFEQFANSCLRNFGIYLRFEGKYPNLSRYEIPDKNTIILRLVSLLDSSTSFLWASMEKSM